jgi:hypothetical protein
MGLRAPGPKTVVCVPSKATEAWLAAALLEDGHSLLTDVECALNWESRLGMLPKTSRIRKTLRDYQPKQALVVSGWGRVRTRCTQAERFSIDVLQAIQGAQGD